MGCGIEIQNKHVKDISTFDLGSLRWNKVIICTDADYDGYHIRTMILAMIYKLMPTLIEKGFVYIAESPLYEIESKSKTYFAYTEKEKADYLKKIGDNKHTVNRSKGLGENDPEMMWMTTMNPASRRLIKVLPTDMKLTLDTFELLLGDNLDGRKNFISENGWRYIEMADIS